MKLVITGSNGLLGQKIVNQCIKKNLDFIAISKGENRNPFCEEKHYYSIDISKQEEVDSLLKEDFTHIIHTAAITNVDYCESFPEECENVNVKATHILFQLAIAKNAHFQLLSTDFVFDGKKGNYDETDEVNPLSVYAKSKVAAESLLLKDDYTNFSIVRTIIVYGTASQLSRSNMILWALDALPKGLEMKLVNDQFRAPTWANDLGWACVQICKLNQKGVFHISGDETLSIEDWVKKIAEILEINQDKIIAISSESLNQSAKRPPRTGFNLKKAKEILGYSPTSFEETIKTLIKELANEEK